MKNFFKRLITWIITKEAKAVLRRHKPSIIVVTGSVGKTSTKDAIFSVLRAAHWVRKSEKSFNSELGVPLTIIGCHNAWYNIFRWISNIFVGVLTILKKRYPDWLILEVGADRPGDISKLAAWINPDIVVITRFAEVPVHIEFFESREAIIAEKASIVSVLNEDGFLITNADDDDALGFQAHTRAKCVTYGFAPEANVRGLQTSPRYRTGVRGYPIGMRLSAGVYGKQFQTDVGGVVGKQSAYHVLASLAVGAILRIPPEKIAEATQNHESPPGRMRIIPGLKKSIIIDDSYNSSPAACEEALFALRELTASGKRIAALGDMLELGKYSIDEHKRVGRLAGEVADVLITVGLRARTIAEGALQAGLSEGQIYQFEDAKEAGQFLQNLIERGDIILVKGSQAVRMEKVVEDIMAEPEHAATLLVRQEREWKNK
jgi:UDP-N-acetylmuramoyl-tripeptide--D-alanyl-D-alanine ligase